MAAENQLSVYLLGKPHIMWGDQHLTIQRRLARIFIYYLASHKSMVSRSELVEFFTNRVGGEVEFLGQFPEIGFDGRVEKEADQKLDPGLGRDQA